MRSTFLAIGVAVALSSLPSLATAIEPDPPGQVDVSVEAGQGKVAVTVTNNGGITTVVKDSGSRAAPQHGGSSSGPPNPVP